MLTSRIDSSVSIAPSPSSEKQCPTTDKIKKFITDHPHLFILSAAVITTAITDQYVPKNFQLTDITAPLLIKVVQGICEHWQIGMDGDDDDEKSKGNKPHWIKQAVAVTLAAGWTVTASSMNWNAVAVSGAGFTALLFKNVLRKLEDVKMGGEKLSSKLQIAIELLVTGGLSVAGFAADYFGNFSLKLGQLGLGIGIATMGRRWNLLLKPVKSIPGVGPNTSKEEKKALKKAAKKQGIPNKQPRSRFLLGAATVATAVGSVGSKFLGAHPVVTDSLIDSLSTASKNTWKSERLRKPAVTDKKNKEELPTPSAQAGFVVTTTALGLASTFGNIPIVTSALTKMASRGLNYLTDSLPNPMPVKAACLVTIASFGGVFKLADGAPTIIRQSGEVGLSLASNVAGLIAKGWQLGKGYWASS
jgi:hypothetical protein